MADTRYIVVVFNDGVGCTLQLNDNLEWFFIKPAQAYKKLPYAIRKANKLDRQYKHGGVCVFKIDKNERLSCDRYENWRRDKERLVYEVNTGTGKRTSRDFFAR